MYDFDIVEKKVYNKLPFYSPLDPAKNSIIPSQKVVLKLVSLFSKNSITDPFMDTSV